VGLQETLALEEAASTLYLLALAIKRDQEYYSLQDEEGMSVIALLQKACTLPHWDVSELGTQVSTRACCCHDLSGL